MKNQSVVQSKRICDIFWDLFPRSVMLGWNNPEQEVVTAHFFGSSDNNSFICVRGVWWKFVSRDVGYYHRTEWDNEWVDLYQIDFLEKVDPPTGVAYSHSLNSKSEDTPFSPTNKEQITALLYAYLYGWAW